jgi:hypothetical protein
MSKVKPVIKRAEVTLVDDSPIKVMLDLSWKIGTWYWVCFVPGVDQYGIGLDPVDAYNEWYRAVH